MNLLPVAILSRRKILSLARAEDKRSTMKSVAEGSHTTLAGPLELFGRAAQDVMRFVDHAAAEDLT